MQCLSNKNFKEQTFVMYQTKKRIARIEQAFLTIEVPFSYDNRLYEKYCNPVCMIFILH